MTDAVRRWAYGLIIAAAVAMAAGRIGSATLVYEPNQPRTWPAAKPRAMPTFGSNDRSRWATVRALVDDGTYAVGKRDVKIVAVSAVAGIASPDPLQSVVAAQAGYAVRTGPAANTGIIFEDGWQSVDKVLHPDTLDYYSSKPPLLSTLVAGLYWLLQRLFGWTLAEQPAWVVRTILLLINALPFGVYLWLLSRLGDRYGRTDEGRLYLVVAAAFATLVLPFLITFNNHTVGTFCVLFAWYSLLRVWRRADGGRFVDYVSAGLFASFAVINELPALAFAAAVFVLMFWRDPGRTLLGFVPPALVVTAGFFVTNHAAIGQWEPAYSEFGSEWYEYEGSHWRKPPEGQKKTGIDWAWQHESRATYALHVLVGHHGLFSLTPIWLLSLVAMVAGALRWRPTSGPAPPGELPWFVQPVGLALTVVVVGFYLFKSDNYGGWTNGLRWLMWLTPIWLTCLLPVVDRLAAVRWGRWLAVALLAASVFSAHYQPWNPWRHPWLYDLMIELGWPGY